MRYRQAALLPQIRAKKFLNVMHRGEVFAAEPPLTLASVGEALAKVARIAPWGIRAGTVVDEQAVVVERLRERYRRIFAVGIHTEGNH